MNLPYFLLYSRLALGIGMVLFLVFPQWYHPYLIVGAMIYGVISDFFDGVLARRQGISSIKFRKQDSDVDQVFWLATIIVIIFHNLDLFVERYLVWCLVVITLEALAYAVCYFRFKKTVASHTLLAKLWTITLLIFLLDMLNGPPPHLSFLVCIGLGILSRLEIILIYASLKNYHTDIPHLGFVAPLNRGEEIKRNKWFNG